MKRTAPVAGTAALLLAAPVAHAQLNLSRESLRLTLEGYANLNAGRFEAMDPMAAAIDHDSLRLDAAARALLRLRTTHGPDAGLRLVWERSNDGRSTFSEFSALLFGSGGRAEIGQRQGLPDVLLGYAPNNFTFTGAEYGPASGPSLDPGGGLVSQFLPSAQAEALNALGSLGASATLADDRSAKLLYVSPKWRGWLAGVSFAPDADDPRFRQLTQIGLTKDIYWDENQLHIGGSASFATVDPSGAGGQTLRADELRSFNAGATLIWRNEWIWGLSAGTDTVNEGTATSTALTAARPARGLVASLNFNRGHWTVGGYAQHAARRSERNSAGDDRLNAFSAGASYRFSAKLRLYGAWHRFDLRAGAAADRPLQVTVLGLRATL